jgi:hypothetical protein
MGMSRAMGGGGLGEWCGLDEGSCELMGDRGCRCAIRHSDLHIRAA